VETREYIESGILEAYILGALSAEEAAQVEANIARYPELGDEMRAIENAMQQYTTTMAIEPPAGLQDKIWAAIQDQSASAGSDETATPKTAKIIPLQPEYRKPAQWKYAAVWVALIGSLVVNLFLWSQGKQDKNDQLAMNTKMEKLQTEQLQLAQLLGDYQKEKTMMADTGMQTIVMHTIQPGHPMAATLYWSKGKGEAYVAIDGLPEPPKGMQYQLWAIQGGKPVDMGILPNSMANTPAIQKVAKQVTSGDAFAISLEKEGGSPTPTMQNIYVMGKA
jgi:anti-sigma-K factor RskA